MKIKAKEAGGILRTAQTMCAVTVKPDGAMEGYKMPGRVGLALRKIIRELTDALRDVEAERMKLIELHAQIGEDGEPMAQDGRYLFREGEEEVFSAAYAELMGSEIDVTERIREQDIADVVILPGLLIGLGPLLVDE